MVRARIFWSGALDGVPTECEFAYPLKEGDAFVMRGDGENYVCTVKQVLQYPVELDSGNVPFVGYIASKQSTRESYWKKEFWKNLGTDLLSRMK